MKLLKKLQSHLLCFIVSAINMLARRHVLIYARRTIEFNKDINEHDVKFEVNNIGIQTQKNFDLIFEQFSKIVKDSQWSFENMPLIDTPILYKDILLAEGHRVFCSDKIVLIIDNFKAFSKTIRQIIQDIERSKVNMPSETELINFLNKGDK